MTFLDLTFHGNFFRMIFLTLQVGIEVSIVVNCVLRANRGAKDRASLLICTEQCVN